MTREQFYENLLKIDITQEEISSFFSEVLENEENSLFYIDHVRKFFSNKEVAPTSGNFFYMNLFRAMISALFSYRTSGGYSPNPVLFHDYLPKPTKESIAMAQWHSSKMEKLHYAMSDKRRGFFRRGERTPDCGTDLQEYLLLYEYEAKGKKA